jgi:hypothetical protein
MSQGANNAAGFASGSRRRLSFICPISTQSTQERGGLLIDRLVEILDNAPAEEEVEAA